jgi:predicted permease
MRRTQIFFTYIVAPAIFFAIVAYSFFSGSSTPFLIAVYVFFGSIAVAAVWALLTRKSTRESRDREREVEFLRKELQTDEKKE